MTVPLELRVENVRSISYVKHAFALSVQPQDFIRLLQPDIVVKGKEFENQSNPEQDAVDSYGGKLIFSSGEARFSSISLLQRDYSEPTLQTINLPRDYQERHAFGVHDLYRALDRFSGARVMVIGDLIVDRYINCDPLGMSQEDPTIVVTPVEQKTFVGGAGIVAGHARGLGADVSFITVASGDSIGQFAEATLDGYGVKTFAVLDETRPTTLKERYRAGGKTLLRVNHLRQHGIDQDTQKGLYAAIERDIRHTDLILFADFNYGCLPQPLVNAVAELGRAHGVMMAADSQASSQMSDISRFRDMTVITPTEREARMAVRDMESGPAHIIESLRDASLARNVIMTLGAEGVLILGDKGGTPQVDRLPAFNSAPKDVAGAGDSLFTCLSIALCTGTDIWCASYLGSLAAAFQVSRVGNTPLTRNDLLLEISQAQSGSD